MAIPVWKHTGTFKNSHLGTSHSNKDFMTIWGLTYLIPKWSQTLFQMGNPQMGILKSICPFTYGNTHMETMNPYGKTFSFGDFLVNPQTVTKSILEQVSD
jgi:hypothetical protein